MSVVHVKSLTISDGTNTNIVVPSDWNSQHNFIQKISGNTIGTSQVSGTDVVWQAGDNITLSGTGSTIIISAAAGGSGGGSPITFSAGGSSGSLSSLVFSNDNGVSFGLNGSTITASVNTNYQSAGAYLTTAMLSDAGSNFVGLNSALTGNGVSATINSSGISLNVPAFLTTAALSGDSTAYQTSVLSTKFLTTAMVSNGGSNFVGLNSALTGNGVSATINSSGISLNVPAFLTTAALSGDSTAYQTSVLSTKFLTTAMASNAGSNFVGLNSALTANGVSATINSSGISLNVPAFLTTAANSTHSHGNPTLNLTNLSGTTASASNGFTLSLSAGNYLTTAMASNAGSNFVGLNSALTGNGVSATINSSGISLNVPAFLTTAMASNAGSNFVGLNSAVTGASLTVNSSGISINVPAAAPSPVYVQAGTTNGSLGTISFNNANGVSFGLNGSTITASLANDPDNWALYGNTSGTTSSSISEYGIYLSGGNNITLSGNSNTIVISAAAAGGGVTVSDYQPPWAFSGRATNSSLGQRSLYLQPFDVDNYVYGSRINFYISINNTLSAANSTGSGNVWMGYALYTQGAGASSTHLVTVTSYSLYVISATMNSNTQYVATHYIGISNATSHSTSQLSISNANASTYPATSIIGPRVIALPLNSTLSPGRYWLALENDVQLAGGMGMSMSIQMTSVGVQPDIRPFGVASAASNASVYRAIQGWGNYSSTVGTAAFPVNSIALTTDNIRPGVNQTLFPFDIKGFATSTNYI